MNANIRRVVDMKLFAISDLHLDHETNLQALEGLSDHRDDWLILAGDTCAVLEDLKFILELLTSRFARVIWVPGNHDLWSRLSRAEEHGEEKYFALVRICREFGVLTPEDSYVVWEGEGGRHCLVPLFLLYDYSFRPDSVPYEKAVEWAAESRVVCTDEDLLHPMPYASRTDWCHARCRYSEERMRIISPGVPSILINHFPLREDLIRIRRIPRFSVWCGTKLTKEWHVRFGASVVVTGHLHMRATDWRDGVRFEEVSLGYPEDWDHRRGIEGYLRQILPSPVMTTATNAGPFWKF